MNILDRDSAERLATLLSASIKGVAFYPPGHPSVATPLKEMYELLRDELQARGEVRLGIVEGSLFIGKEIFVAPKAAIEELAALFMAREIRQVSLLKGLAVGDLTRFVMLVAPKNALADQITLSLATDGITTIKVISDHEESEGDLDDIEEITEIDDTTAVQTYRTTLTVVQDLFREIERGRIPSSRRVMKVIKNFVTITMHDPSTLLGLSMIKDYDNYTFNHSVNVGVLSMAMAASLSMERKEIEEIGAAGLLHDVGKTGIDKKILNKPGRFTSSEFEVMKKHPEIGAMIIRKMEGFSEAIAHGVLGHHIMHNRKGYPEWAQGESFGIVADIISIADCYDACTTLRCYQRPMSPKSAISQLQSMAGTHLNPELLLRFIDMMGRFPVGTLVRLDNNEVAVVFRPNPVDSERPVVKIVFDAAGSQLPLGRTENLASGTGRPYASIVAEVDPILKNIDVARYLT
jgi:putative nucleotidyltransferase with HDIG domain